MIMEEQADKWCMGTMNGSEIVRACREAAVTALREAMDDTYNRLPILSLAADKRMYEYTDILISSN